MSNLDFPIRRLFSLCLLPNTILPVSTALLISLLKSTDLAIIFAVPFVLAFSAFSDFFVLFAIASLLFFGFHYKVYNSCADFNRLSDNNILRNSLQKIFFSLKCSIKEVLHSFLKRSPCKRACLLPCNACPHNSFYVSLKCHQISEQHYVPHINIDIFLLENPVKLFDNCPSACFNSKNFAYFLNVICCCPFAINFLKFHNCFQICSTCLDYIFFPFLDNNCLVNASHSLNPCIEQLVDVPSYLEQWVVFKCEDKDILALCGFCLELFFYLVRKILNVDIPVLCLLLHQLYRHLFLVHLLGNLNNIKHPDIYEGFCKLVNNIEILFNFLIKHVDCHGRIARLAPSIDNFLNSLNS